MIPLFSLELHAACIQDLTCLDGKTLVDVTWKHDVLKAEASTAFTCIRTNTIPTARVNVAMCPLSRMEIALEVTPEETQKGVTLNGEQKESEADVDETKGLPLMITL